VGSLLGLSLRLGETRDQQHTSGKGAGLPAVQETSVADRGVDVTLVHRCNYKVAQKMLHDSDVCTLRRILSACRNQEGYGGRDMQQALQIQRIIHKFWLQDLKLSDQLRLGVKVKVKCTLVQALRLCTGRTAHRGSRGIALLFHDQRH